MNTKLSPKEIGVRWFHEVWNNRNAAAISELMSPDTQGHLEGGQEIVGPGQFIAYQKAILEALPDLEVKVLNALSDGDDACVLWQASAVHSGPGFGFVPTGNQVSIRGTTWFHVVDGRITEAWDAWNQGGLFTTMGTSDVAI